MAVEIERKFLVVSDGWRASITRTMKLEQGYLAQSRGTSVRVRVRDQAHAFLTVKTGAPGLVRTEYEYPIPVVDAEELLELCAPHILTKQRHLVPVADLIWEVDVFEGRHAGLVLAEIELDAADRVIDLPGWIGEEVTANPQYYNAALAAL